MDMSLRDGGTCTGTSLSFSTVSFSSSTWNILGMFGPVMSRSMIPTWNPAMESASARFDETVDLPTPPFPESTMITCLMPARVSLSLVSSSICSALSTGDDIAISFYASASLVRNKAFVLMAPVRPGSVFQTRRESDLRSIGRSRPPRNQMS